MRTHPHCFPTLPNCSIAGALFLLAALPDNSTAANVQVSSRSALQNALQRAQPGDRIEIGPGTYRGGISAQDLSGEAGNPIVIHGIAGDDGTLPVFSGGSSAFHFSNCSHLVIRNLRVTDCSGNGINIDDGGSSGTPAQDILVENVVIQNIGPMGNHDALKLSGVTDFQVRDCAISGWGGSGIDMVGCRDGIIADCRFEGKEGFSQSNAVQIKGGSRNIQVMRCFFKDPGHRAINIGGSTGLPYFRPEPEDFEAKEVEIAGNRFVGGMAAIAWATAQGGRVHHNTFYGQDKWILRILQENQDPRFRPCAGGVFENNVVVHDNRVQVHVNVGPGVDAGSFTFRENVWHNREAAGARAPQLPAKETEGVYDVDPELALAGESELQVRSRNARLAGKGAEGFEPAGGKGAPPGRSDP
ncbi:MAG TPA: right-handed parallel beta-helix repeat-containing protein [Verrucomicrobiales bacterium]|nr:right-handed parallel beta-helix repeat-containing protein [Verrucomicrobiales bacterium]